MKSIGKILLIIISILAVIGSVWVIFTSDGENTDPNSAAVTFNIFLALAVVAFSFLLFIAFKVTDLMKHPKHLKELLLLIVIIAVALVIGYAISGFDKYVGPILAVFVLIAGATVFLLKDMIKGLLK